MKSQEQLLAEGLIDDSPPKSKAHVIGFYRDQLKKFEKLGIGNRTDNRVIVTQTLIDTTEKRLNQLSSLSERIKDSKPKAKVKYNRMLEKKIIDYYKNKESK